ncbi:MAG: hypothetical protein ACXVJO_03385, partial [Thermoanaerobaculia bacterium]
FGRNFSATLATLAIFATAFFAAATGFAARRAAGFAAFVTRFFGCAGRALFARATGFRAALFFAVTAAFLRCAFGIDLSRRSEK